jgi:hypothetical protein
MRNWPNKLECLSLANLSELIKILRYRLELTLKGSYHFPEWKRHEKYSFLWSFLNIGFDSWPYSQILDPAENTRQGQTL